MDKNVNFKPKYLILYKDDEWKLNFIKKRLLNFTNNVISNKNEMKMEYFDVLFRKSYTDLNGNRLFGIIIQDGVEIDEHEINRTLKPLIYNPFIGAIHVMK